MYVLPDGLKHEQHVIKKEMKCKFSSAKGEFLVQPKSCLTVTMYVASICPFVFGSCLPQLSEKGQSLVKASVHGRGKARRGGGARLWFNVADCAPMKKRNSFFCVNFQFCCCLCAQPLCPILLPSLNDTTSPLFFFSFHFSSRQAV